VEHMEFYKPADDSAEMSYLRARRAALGGYIPRRRMKSTQPLATPTLDSFAKFAIEADGKEMSTTMAVVRMLSGLLKDKVIGKHIVPIVADEARTFGMANLFRQIGIYSPIGQIYEPEDLGSMLYYKEEKSGQILEEGISEAAAISSWIAAATAYSVHDLPMLPFYIYYSMFGFQRVGDLIWAAADQRARGFLLGATSGRTTLGGEGLQHQDGTSHVQFATVPNCRAYDPAFSYELAVIIERGMVEMLQEQQDRFYYLTVMNANYAQPSMPPGEAIREGILKGMYRLPGAAEVQVQLLGSGAIMTEVLAARELLKQDWGIEAALWSVTSYVELHRDGIDCERRARLHPKAEPAQPFVSRALSGSTAPVIAATDYVRALPELIRAFVPQRYITLGTDGFGRSDTRAALRAFFEVDAVSIVIAALQGLAEDRVIERNRVAEAIAKYGRSPDAPASWTR
jgi:pyruvate dehydrogenase E1 component